MKNLILFLITLFAISCTPDLTEDKDGLKSCASDCVVVYDAEDGFIDNLCHGNLIWVDWTDGYWDLCFNDGMTVTDFGRFDVLYSDHSVDPWRANVIDNCISFQVSPNDMNELLVENGFYIETDLKKKSCGLNDVGIHGSTDAPIHVEFLTNNMEIMRETVTYDSYLIVDKNTKEEGSAVASVFSNIEKLRSDAVSAVFSSIESIRTYGEIEKSLQKGKSVILRKDNLLRALVQDKDVWKLSNSFEL